MAATTRLRSLETVNGLSRTSPPCSSPTKRSNTSPSLGVEGSPRILRTKLSNGKEEEIRLELDVEGIENRNLPHDPSTPPEYHETDSLVGLGVNGLITEDKGQIIEQELESNEGATQTETAERQTRELGQLSYQAQNLLARLCSQHPYSEYNNLKRAVAAAVPGTQVPVQHIQTAPPVPPFRHAQSAGPSTFPSPTPSSRPSPPLRTASAGPLASPQSTRSVESTRTTRSSVNPPPRSTLTPSLARVNFEFSLNAQPTTSATPVVVQQRSAAEHTVDTILNDLVEGEPVKVERTPTKVVVSDTIPTQPPAVVPGLLPGMQLVNGVPVKTSTSHPINISPLVPPELLPYFAARIFSTSTSPSSNNSTPSGLPSSDETASSFIINPQPSCDLLTMITPISNGICPVLPHSSYRPPNSSIPPFIGNFMLSSCPGKKVRMNGEALKGGRGAICRDVKLDLQRAKDEGVRMVVCCLDDSELAYLGTPFSEYSAACTELELQVLRIPMVEGFAPSSPASLDTQLDRLIKNHTLKGESVLAHCRGGIGRAGLVASCWMIKMGMVGRRHGFEEMRRGEKEWKDEDPIVIVERVIELIRKRRSVKSIETTHQVRFLLQYIEFLQTNARFVSASELTTLDSPNINTE